jgi:hypothetical protein
MKKTAAEIANDVVTKLSAYENTPEGDEDLPGYMYLRTPTSEGAGMAALRGGLAGAPVGAFAAGFSERAAKRIPNDTARILVGLLGGGALGAGTSVGLNTLANKLLTSLSKKEENKLLASGQVSPEENAKARELWQAYHPGKDVDA